jgi:hypothetical protein
MQGKKNCGNMESFVLDDDILYFTINFLVFRSPF